jgi:hypothetical protein
VSEGNPYDVAVDQIWQDNDSRYQTEKTQRFIRVTEIGYTHAKYITVDKTDRLHPSALRAREGKIRLDRFRPNASGYRRREDLEGQR